jgi:hypothetical protein
MIGLTTYRDLNHVYLTRRSIEILLDYYDNLYYPKPYDPA